jgi:hypothetical protein
MDNLQASERASDNKTIKVSESGIARFGAYTAIVLGSLGMLFCLPFLYSASIPDLIGAGFPFVGGAVIAGMGLIALSILVRK